MFQRPVAVAALAVLLLASLSCRREPATCAICRMPIPADTYTGVSMDGRREIVCDPRCALTYQEQTGKPVGLEVVTDFRSRTRLEPRDAFYVTGSDVAPDSHTTAVRAWPATTAELHWHRCLPSVLAFRKRDDAEAFRRQHGGRLTSLAELGFAGGRARPAPPGSAP
jgi:hypothetical protein